MSEDTVALVAAVIRENLKSQAAPEAAEEEEEGPVSGSARESGPVMPLRLSVNVVKLVVEYRSKELEGEAW